MLLLRQTPPAAGSLVFRDNFLTGKQTIPCLLKLYSGLRAFEGFAG